MSTITVSGLGSGLSYDVWIQELVAVKQADIDNVNKQVSGIKSQESALSTIESYYTKLQTSIQSLADTNSTNSVFNQKSASSSSDVITATADSTATVQNINVSVTSLATATTAKSTSTVASYASSTTKLSDISEGAVKAGTLSVYVDGVKHTLTLTTDQTLDDVVKSLNYDSDAGTGIQGVSASLSNGKLTISASGGSTVTVGASSDTSNFTKVMSLTRNTDTGVYTSSKAAFSTNTTATLTSTSFAGGSVTAGTFKIGNAEFTVDSTTTLKSLIAKINNNDDAGATAYWDQNAGKLVLTAADQGATNINIEAGTSNFTDIMGLTSGGNIVQAAQTLGTNAVLSINGTSITSSSNTITSDISGVKGLTLTLKDKTSSDATIKISNDVSSAVTAITNIVSAFNMAITNTKTATASDGSLYGQSVLTMMATSVRQNATASVSFDNTYKNLASIGITTGAIGTDVKADTSQLKIDTTKLTAALQNDPTAVMNLLIGNNTLKTNGAFTKIATGLDNSLNASSGYFTTQEKSFEKKVTNLNNKVKKMTTDLTKYQSDLEAKFQAMDELISNLQNSSSIFNSYFNNKKNSNSN